MIRRALVLLALGALCTPTFTPTLADEAHGGSPGAAGRSWDLALTKSGEPGKPFVIEGTLLGLPDSLPIHGAAIYLHHADASGNYGPHGDSRPRLAGTVTTNIAGGFRVRTVLPGTYDGTPHLHYRVTVSRIEHRGTLSLARRVGAGSDSAYDKVPWMLELPAGTWADADPAGDGGFHCSWKLYVQRPGP